MSGSVGDASGTQLVKTSPTGEFRVHKLGPEDAEDLAEFLNWLRTHHWSLTSLAHTREPQNKPLVSASELIVSEGAPNRLGTFLLRRADKIIASVVVDEKTEEGSCAAIISAAETHPDYQRRGTFWRWLGIPLIRVLCESHFDRLEAQTWVLNRKGISVYERFGFRRVPGEGVRMINLLPTLVRSPGLRRHLAGVDWLRDLQWRRGPMGPAGPDSVCYEWRRRSSHSSVVAVVVKAAEW